MRRARPYLAATKIPSSGAARRDAASGACWPGAVAGMATLLCAATCSAALAAGTAGGAALAVGTTTRPSLQGPAATSDDPRSWLARADRALATRNYRGVFVHEYAGETETLRVVQRVGADGLAERLQSMDGSGREFIRRGNQLYCYLPDRHMVLVERSPGSLLLGGLPNPDATLTGQYRVRQVARARVSGRRTRVIGIEPMDQLRYGYRVWIDEATAMPLRMQLRDPRGRVLEEIVFTELALPAHIAGSELQPAVDARNYRWVQQDASAQSAANAADLSVAWQASALPPGFHMTGSARQMLPGGPAEHLVFSDGLASVSVFVQLRHERGSPLPSEDSASLGTSSAYSVAVQNYRVTVVGEVPPQTVRDIAQAFRGAGSPPGIGESSLGVPTPLPASAAAGTGPLGVPLLLPRSGEESRETPGFLGSGAPGALGGLGSPRGFGGPQPGFGAAAAGAGSHRH